MICVPQRRLGGRRDRCRGHQRRTARRLRRHGGVGLHPPSERSPTAPTHRMVPHWLGPHRLGPPTADAAADADSPAPVHPCCRSSRRTVVAVVVPPLPRRPSRGNWPIRPRHRPPLALPSPPSPPLPPLSHHPVPALPPRPCIAAPGRPNHRLPAAGPSGSGPAAPPVPPCCRHRDHRRRPDRQCRSRHPDHHCRPARPHRPAPPFVKTSGTAVASATALASVAAVPVGSVVLPP